MASRRAARGPDAVSPRLGLDPPNAHAPLAARMRPLRLDELVGQAHLVGERGALRRMVEAGHLASLLLWGAPGVGKTTLARLLAEAVDAPYVTLSAVMSGVADVRAVIAGARGWIERGGRSTVLFIDELHRFHRGQQDALLSHVEDGTVTLIGATTENPWFEVNSALLSRLRVVRLESLSEGELSTIIDRAISDARGFGGRVELPDDARAHLLTTSAGDARVALNILEAAVALAGGVAPLADASGSPPTAVRPTLPDVEEAAQQRLLAYDRSGDGHYGTVSAFIKSLRGNDPHAALYWLASMIAAGEDPRFICRRLIISASEDVGNADPRALQVAVAAAEAVDRVGLPEARYALAQATALIAVLPKSSAVADAYARAMSDVEQHGSLPVPRHLLPGGHRGLRAHGIGVGYRDPHDHEGEDIEQQYLPDALAERRYYVATDQGQEAGLRARMEEREAHRAEGPPRRRRRGLGDTARGVSEG